VFAKLVAVILGIGVIGGGLLAMRQQRLEAASALARMQVRIRAQDETLWSLRAKIAQSINPEHVREMAVALGPLRPMVPLAHPHAPDSRRASVEPVIVDSEPLARPPGARPRVDPVPGSPKRSHAGSRYAKVETDR